MRQTPPNQHRLTPEACIRLRLPETLASTDECGMNGFFHIPVGKEILRVMVSDGGGWEHVSVSLRHRCPTWEEMCRIKSIFWDDEEEVVQFHPKKSEYVNCHPFCLHLWRPTEAAMPTPPSIYVGFKG